MRKASRTVPSLDVAIAEAPEIRLTLKFGMTLTLIRIPARDCPSMLPWRGSAATTPESSITNPSASRRQMRADAIGMTPQSNEGATLSFRSAEVSVVFEAVLDGNCPARSVTGRGFAGHCRAKYGLLEVNRNLGIKS